MIRFRLCGSEAAKELSIIPPVQAMIISGVHPLVRFPRIKLPPLAFSEVLLQDIHGWAYMRI
jgi:hypothetical protein